MEQEEGIFKLILINADTEPEKELRELVKHMQNQMKNRYMYLVGEWANGKRAKNTRNGQFASKEEVKKFLDNGN